MQFVPIQPARQVLSVSLLPPTSAEGMVEDEKNRLAYVDEDDVSHASKDTSTHETDSDKKEHARKTLEILRTIQNEKSPKKSTKGRVARKFSDPESEQNTHKQALYKKKITKVKSARYSFFKEFQKMTQVASLVSISVLKGKIKNISLLIDHLISESKRIKSRIHEKPRLAEYKIGKDSAVKQHIYIKALPKVKRISSKKSYSIKFPQLIASEASGIWVMRYLIFAFLIHAKQMKVLNTSNFNPLIINKHVHAWLCLHNSLSYTF